MKLNKRETFMLWKLLEFHMHRYLLTFVRKQGYERAERHIEMSKVLWEVQNCATATPDKFREWMDIHDLIADKITNHLPRTIGFDMDAEEHDWDILTDRFFKCILKLNLQSKL